MFQMRLAVVAGVLLLGVGLSQAQAPALRAAEPVQVRAENLDQSNNALRLPRVWQQAPGQPLSLEAEGATVLRFTPGKGVMGQTDGASGGLYVAFVDHAEFQFQVAEAGTYTAWYRGSFPLKGSWNHTESMDGGPTQTHVDSQGEVLDQWLWVKGPSYELTAGRHSWNFTPYGWCGGTKLDKVLLVKDPAFVPEGLGPAASANTAAASGEAVTEQLQPRTLVRWRQVKFDNAGAGAVSVWATTDSAVSWQPVPASGDLSALPPGKPLALKLQLQAAPDGGSPYVKNLRVEYEAKPVPPLVLENEALKLTFAGDSGALIGLTNKLTRTECLTPGVETPLFSFVGYRPQFHTVVEIGFGQAQLRQAKVEKGQAKLSFAVLGGDLLADVTVTLRGPKARFGMTVTNKSPYEVAQVRLLSPKGLRIGDDCQDDYLFTPITTGSIVKYPAALEYPRQIYTDRPLAYPGMATMCWMDLWDDRGGGVYLACEDPRYRLTELTFSNGADDRPVKDEAQGTPPPGDPAYKYARVPGSYVNLGFDKRLRVAPGAGPVVIPDVVLGVHAGDWHWGADQYRAWAEPWMSKVKQTPDWLRDTFGIANIHCIHLGRFTELSKGWARGGRQGDMRDTLFPLVAAWAQQASCEAYWSTPVLHLLLGNEAEFAGGVQKQHEMGHRFVSYNLPRSINPLFNQNESRVGSVPISMYDRDVVPPSGFYAEVGSRLYDGNLRSADGVYSEASVCFGAKRWQDYETHIILDKYIKQYGNDGMYMDGLGLDDLATQDCKSLTHGHNTFGEGPYEMIKWLGGLKTATRQVRPGAMYFGEGMGDVYHTVLDTGLFYPENAPEAYLYTCPWNIGLLMPGTAPIPGWPAGGLEYAAVYGLRISGLDQNFEVDPARFRQYMVFRERFHQLQSRARFRDRLGLSVSDPKVTARLFTRQDAGNRYALASAYNPAKTAGVTVTVRAAAAGAVRQGWACDMDGGWQPLPVRQEGDKYVFTLPATELTVCLLAEKCEPLVSVAEPRPIVPGDTGKVAVTVTNLESQPLAATLGLQLPAGWKTVAAPVTVASGQSVTRELPCTVSAGTKYDVHDIYAVATEKTRLTKRCRPLGVCHAVQAELYFTAGDRLRLALENVSQRPVTATCALQTPAGVTADPGTAPVSLAPGAKGEAVFSLGNVARVTTLQHLEAHVRYGREKVVAYEQLQPPVLNGGFEDDTAGDGRPDYWNYRFPEELYVNPGFVLDHEVAAEGKVSLRLDPYPQDTRNHILTTFIRLVPGARYRLSCQIRRSEHNPSVVVRLWSMYSRDGRNPVTDVWLGMQKDGPVNQWDKFQAEFTAADKDVPYNLMVCNNNRSTATAWFDDFRLEEIR